MKATCIVCGKKYVYWRCIHRHYDKVHPNAKNIIRILEIAEAHNKEAAEFLKIGPMDWNKK